MAIINPFLEAPTDKAIVAIKGRRSGYLQIAPSIETNTYESLPLNILIAARAWAVALESLGAKRVYWITLSEMVRHLHIHLYPRWMETEAKGIELFEGRETQPQPDWTEPVETALYRWAETYHAEIRGGVSDFKLKFPDNAG